MGIIFHKKKKYGGAGVKVQSDASATSLDALKVPNGQTIESYINSKFVVYPTKSFQFSNSQYATRAVSDIDSNLPNVKYLGVFNAAGGTGYLIGLNLAKTEVVLTSLGVSTNTVYVNIFAIY